MDVAPNLLIAIPTYGGVAPEQAAAVLGLQGWLTAQGLQGRVVQQNMAEIARSRNKLAATFLEHEAATHLLFIDSDIDFQPSAVEALLRADRPLVGAVYPRRSIDLDRLIEAARRLTDRAEIVASALDFVVVPDGAEAEVTDGLCRVGGVGMGLCLIRREVFARLLATGQIRREHTPWGSEGLKGPVHGFFDPIIDGAAMLAEDLSFCRRWRTLCGGEVWAVLDQEIGHVGTMTFRGRMIDAFSAAAHGHGDR